MLPDSNHAEAGQDACDGLDAELLQFETDKQVLGLLSMLKTGHNKELAPHLISDLHITEQSGADCFHMNVAVSGVASQGPIA